MSGKLWTDAETAMLRQREGFEPIADIARDLRRSPRSVESKLTRMKGAARIEFERDQLRSCVSHETKVAA